MRPSNRIATQLRPITLTRHYVKHAPASVLVEFGDTKVLCIASIAPGVPRFLKGSGTGWLTAEYGMLPHATQTRTEREASRGKQGGRTLEIQRLIGRSLRTVVDLSVLGEQTITIDCDVIQADGGTRTAAITGSCVALALLLKSLPLKTNPLKQMIAAVSVGIYKSTPILDLDYIEDSNAETDMNVVMTEKGEFIEIQGTAEKKAFTAQELTAMLETATAGIQEIIAIQKAVLE